MLVGGFPLPCPPFLTGHPVHCLRTHKWTVMDGLPGAHAGLFGHMQLEMKQKRYGVVVQVCQPEWGRSCSHYQVVSSPSRLLQAA